jgi:hypothetical protein
LNSLHDPAPDNSITAHVPSSTSNKAPDAQDIHVQNARYDYIRSICLGFRSFDTPLPYDQHLNICFRLSSFSYGSYVHTNHRDGIYFWNQVQFKYSTYVRTHCNYSTSFPGRIYHNTAVGACSRFIQVRQELIRTLRLLQESLTARIVLLRYPGGGFGPPF